MGTEETHTHTEDTHRGTETKRHTHKERERGVRGGAAAGCLGREGKKAEQQRGV